MTDMLSILTGNSDAGNKLLVAACCYAAYAPYNYDLNSPAEF